MTDNKGNVYTKDIDRLTTGANVSIWRSSNVATGGSSFTVTASSPTFSGPLMLAIVECDKNLKLISTAIGGLGPTNNPSLALSVFSADAYAAIAFDAGPHGGTIVSPSGWQSRVRDVFMQLAEGMDRLFTSSGAVIATWTLNQAYSWVACGAVYTPALQANFTGTPTSGAAPLSVTFTDSSTGSPTTWAWDFGDGSTDTVQNPVHSYAAAGTYTVTLTVTSAAGTSQFSRASYITVGAGGTPSGTPVPPGIPNAPIMTFGPPIPGAPWNQGQPYVPVYTPPPNPAVTTLVTTPLLVPTVNDQDRLRRESRLVSLILNALTRMKSLFRSGPDTYGVRTAGFHEARPPTVTDDSSIGARPGVTWIDTHAGVGYLCYGADIGAADWRVVATISPTTGLSGGATGTFP